MKRAFSYIRFSDIKQAKGDSLRRQLEWGPALCSAKGWNLDESFEPDAGVSAFRGKNAATGTLSRFLSAIGTKVAPGDVLLVENLDRLSRQDIDPAWELFRRILKAGVEIHTREPERHYLPADLNNFGTRIEVQAYALRAFNESATKSMRGKAYWEGLRSRLPGKKPVHKVLPAWLRLSADRQQFLVRPDAAKAIRLIFQWAGEGLGMNPITIRLNQQGVPPIGDNVRRVVRKNRWCRSYVGKLLRDRAVLGEFQPHVMKDGKRVPHGEPVAGYFPAVITEQQWYAVRAAVKGRGETRGRRGPVVSNLFMGLIRDARDGTVMHLGYAGSSRKGNARILVSDGARNGCSPRMAFPYDAIERAFLTTVRELKAGDIAGDGEDRHEAEISGLAGRLSGLGAKIAAVQRRVLEEQGIDALIGLLEKLDAERRAVAASLEQARAAAAQQQPAALDEAKSLMAMLGKVQGEQRRDLRTKISARIRQLVAEMWMLVWDMTDELRVAEIQMFFHGGKVKNFLLAWFRKGKRIGEVGGQAADLAHPGEGIADADLRRYRTDAKVRRRHEDAHNRLRRQVGAAPPSRTSGASPARNA
jgi:DNA invertase Pin-like site-specific DNA recombinase